MTESPAPAVSLYDRLVERVIELPRWPTSRKTALVVAVALVFHVITSAAVSLSLSSLTRTLDVPAIMRLSWLWCGALALVLAAALAASARGWEARWTVYLLIAVYVLFLVRLLSLFGMMSTPLVAWAPVLLLFVGLFFDARAGAVASISWLALFGLFSALEASGVIPYAGAVLDRTLDAQREPRYYVTVFFVLQAVFAYALLLSTLTASARERQQEQLERANASLAEARDQVSRANDLISRYVASQLSQQILAGNYDALQRHDRRKLTLFFSDIKDFSEIADHAEPEDLSEVLNEYLSEMASIGERYGGTIDKFVGDAIMIFFGAPEQTNDRDHALRAVQMAIEMQERMATLREKWRKDGFERPFHIRIGLNTGRATIGNFGSKGRVDYTAIGRQVNLAARLQTHCEPGKILISHSTWVLIQEGVACTEKGDITVKGFQNPVSVYEVVGLRGGAGGAGAGGGRDESALG